MHNVSKPWRKNDRPHSRLAWEPLGDGVRAYVRYDGDVGATANNHVLSASLRVTSLRHCRSNADRIATASDPIGRANRHVLG